MIGMPSLKISKIRVEKNQEVAYGNPLYFWHIPPGDCLVMFFFYNIFDYCSWLPYTDTFFHQVGILFKLKKKKSQLLEKQLENVSHLPSMLSASLPVVGYLGLFFHLSSLRSSSRDAI